GALDGGERRMRFLSRKDEEPAAVRARRRRRARRRAFYLGTGIAAAVALLAAGWYATRSGMLCAALAPLETRLTKDSAALHLTVQSVEVIGRERADRNAILAALRVRRGTPILGVDLDAAKTRIEALPWVLSAAVERELPEGILVRLVERRPMAVWQHHRRFDVIDQSGAVVQEARAEDFPNLLQIVGDDAPAATGDFLALLAAEPELVRHVTAATRVGGRRWNIALDNGIEVMLPEDDPGAAWQRLAALDRDDHLLEREVTVIDMRMADRLVLRLPPEIAKSLIKKLGPTRPNA
ncbi:MAG: cell division protein FtsQ/DivIB, partial [Stellaceae bacterium]